MKSCLFCKIISGEIPGTFVHKNDHIVAFRDISPKAPIHILVVPVKHFTSLNDIDTTDVQVLANLFLAVKKIAKDEGLVGSGYKVIINNGKGAGQVISHLHLHILGGWGKSTKWEV